MYIYLTELRVSFGELIPNRSVSLLVCNGEDQLQQQSETDPGQFNKITRIKYFS